MTQPRRLYRQSSTGRIAGVCAGIAEYLDSDVALVRLAWVVLSVVPGGFIGGILAYLAAWLIVPDASQTVPAGQLPRRLTRSATDRKVAGVCGGLAEILQRRRDSRPSRLGCADSRTWVCRAWRVCLPRRLVHHAFADGGPRRCRLSLVGSVRTGSPRPVGPSTPASGHTLRWARTTSSVSSLMAHRRRSGLFRECRTRWRRGARKEASVRPGGP